MEKIAELNINTDTLNKKMKKVSLPFQRLRKQETAKFLNLSSDVTIVILGSNINRNACMHIHICSHYLLLIKLDFFGNYKFTKGEKYSVAAA